MCAKSQSAIRLLPSQRGQGDALTPWVLGVLLLCGSILTLATLPLMDDPVRSLERAGWILALIRTE